MPSPPPAFGRARPAENRPPLPAKGRALAAAILPKPNDAAAAELSAWNRTRERNPFPWRQLSLVGGLCFGVASLVLPDSVNDAAAYALYAIAGIGFIGGLSRRRKKPF